jgi:hypothetical protein
MGIVPRFSPNSWDSLLSCPQNMMGLITWHELLLGKVAATQLHVGTPVAHVTRPCTTGRLVDKFSAVDSNLHADLFKRGILQHILESTFCCGLPASWRTAVRRARRAMAEVCHMLLRGRRRAHRHRDCAGEHCRLCSRDDEGLKTLVSAMDAKAFPRWVILVHCASNSAIMQSTSAAE